MAEPVLKGVAGEFAESLGVPGDGVRRLGRSRSSQPQRRIDIDLAPDVDDLDAVLRVVTQLQIHKSSSAMAMHSWDVRKRFVIRTE